jgi:SAM-dependent methyltransferase
MRDRPLRAAAYAPATVETVNSGHWSGAKLASRRARARFRPAELGLGRRHAGPLSGDVLELGCAGGLLTSALVASADTFTGVGPCAPALVVAAGRHPSATFVCGDLRDFDTLGEQRFTAVVMARRVIDLFGDTERRLLLDRIHRALAGDGVLLFSSPNLGCESLVPPPARNLTANPVRLANRLARLPRALRNRAVLAPLQEREHGWAILNTPAHDYALLQYFISRDAQERQLADHGFSMLECVTADDEPVPPGDLAYGSVELFYAARPTR